MVLYDIKKGWFKNVGDGALEALMKETFGNCKREGSGMLVSSFGVLDRIEAEIMGKDSLRVDTVNKSGPLSDDDILKTKRKLNVFVEKATGFDSKARMKRAQAKAKKGEL